MRLAAQLFVVLAILLLAIVTVHAEGPLQLQPGLQAARQPIQAAPHLTDNRYLRSLNMALAHYEAIADRGGWGRVPGDEALRLGSTGAAVAALRARLAATGELRPGYSRPELFDAELEAAVILYQARNGLDADGIVGAATFAALNKSVEWRIRQIRLNIERWRQMPEYLGERYVLVNIAAFGLELVERDAIAMEMRVIVGKDYRQTPEFSDRIRYIEFNPYWNVPDSIANRDLVPKFSDDPSYPVANGFTAWQGSDQVPITAINWGSYRGGRLPYTLRQDPGPLNALGEMKFMFPNQHAVYLHDTPAKELFSRTVRTFSSGCIRVERPVDLAAALLADAPSWPAARILRVLDSRQNTQAPLSEPVPVHLIYMTAWTDRTGTVQFRPDIYGRDEELARALFER
jgi:murein L,D-transpeptidase YcbB/YkuD